MNKKVLNLTLNKVWFDLMICGIKPKEYRKPTKWILSRLFNKDGTKKEYSHIKFVNGYGSDKPYFVAEFKGFEFSSTDHVAVYDKRSVHVEIGDVIIQLGQITETNKD